jgi:sugar-specific transcriptional regulator TrmB
MRTIGVEGKVDELLVCLDKDVERIERSLSRLNELRTLVIKRDDGALSKLLENIQAETDRYKSQESSRQSIRRELADALGCDFKHMTLSALEKSLPRAKKDQISRTKAKLKSLIEKLKKEYLSTILLLSECSRLNNLLLRSIFDLGRTGGIYYSADGVTRRHTDTGFLNLQF